MNATPTPPPVAAVVVNWNMAALTISCVESLLASDYPALTVVVVDNGSSDGSADLIAARLPAATLLRSNSNLGFAAGANLGIRAALAHGAAYVLLLNNDTYVAPTMLGALVQTLEDDPAAGMAGPLICYADRPELVWYLGDRARAWLPVPRRLGSGRRAKELGSTPLRVDYLCGCGMLVRRALFERVGLLDERFYMYFEDADFCQRARAAGFGAWGVPAARMWHHVSLSAQRVAASSRERVTRYRIIFYRRYTSGPRLLAAGAFVCYAALRALVGDLRRGQLNLVLPTLRGFWAGWRAEC